MAFPLVSRLHAQSLFVTIYDLDFSLYKTAVLSFLEDDCFGPKERAEKE